MLESWFSAIFALISSPKFLVCLNGSMGGGGKERLIQS